MRRWYLSFFFDRSFWVLRNFLSIKLHASFTSGLFDQIQISNGRELSSLFIIFPYDVFLTTFAVGYRYNSYQAMSRIHHVLPGNRSICADTVYLWKSFPFGWAGSRPIGQRPIHNLPRKQGGISTWEDLQKADNWPSYLITYLHKPSSRVNLFIQSHGDFCNLLIIFE